jgi:hypothetical protein
VVVVHARKVLRVAFAHRKRRTVWQAILSQPEGDSFIEPDHLLDIIKQADKFLAHVSHARHNSKPDRQHHSAQKC